MNYLKYIQNILYNLLKEITGYKRVNMVEQIAGLIFSNPRSFSVDSERLKETL